MIVRFALAAVTAIAFVGCGGDDETTTTVTTTVTTATAEPGWDGPLEPAADGSLAVDGFNAHLDATGSSQPVMIAAEFVRAERQEAARTSFVAEQAPEGGSTATVVATFDGLLDDSIRAIRYTLELERRSGGWRLASARRDQRCHQGRGHQDFSPERCV